MKSLDTPVFSVIVGSGRSGTTWVQDVLARANGLRTAFEPLHPKALPEIAHYAGSFLDEKFEDDVLERYLLTVFSGESKNIWVNYRVRPDRLKFDISLLTSPRLLYEYVRRVRKLLKYYFAYRKDKGRPVLTKFIRANGFILWMLERFNVRILCIVRHPAAVVESKMRLGGEDWDPDTAIERVLKQTYTPIHSEHMKKYKKLIHGGLSLAGKHAVIWCIENKQILEMNSVTNFQVCFYEDLILSAEKEWERICKFFSFNNVPEDSLYSKASQQARPERMYSKYKSGDIGKWKKGLTSDELNEIQRVLDVFEITSYNIDFFEPLRSI